MKKCKWNGGWTSFHVQYKKNNNGVKEGWLLRGDELCVCCEREYCLFWNYKSRFDSRMGFVGRMQRMAGGWSEWSLEVVWCLLFQCARSRNNKNSSGGSVVALPPKCSSKAWRPAGIALTDAMDDQQCQQCKRERVRREKNASNTPSVSCYVGSLLLCGMTFLRRTRNWSPFLMGCYGSSPAWDGR